ncbi:MAG TPA: YdcF family protein [Vicinamibacterales bacterium]|jgi:uncharacterized SAM-binding protein YcdF (DUF218 family)
MVNAVKWFLVPGSIPFLVLGLVLGVGLLYGGQSAQRWGRRWLTALLAVYGLLATPIGAELVSAPLARQYGALTSREQAKDATVVVVLTSGSEVYRANGREIVQMSSNSAQNAIEAARLYSLLGAPTVVVSGGIVSAGQQQRSEADAVADGLVRLGVPRERIIVEGQSRTTRENAQYSAALLRPRGVRRVVLVTNSRHMQRAVAEFRAEHIEPIPSVAAFESATPTGLIHQIRPRYFALRQSDDACHEYLARMYYLWQGWRSENTQ